MPMSGAVNAFLLLIATFATIAISTKTGIKPMLSDATLGHARMLKNLGAS